MKKFFQIVAGSLALLVTMNFAETVRLDRFQDILSALKSGNQVRAVFHYRDCKLIIEGKAIGDVPDAVGGMAMDTLMVLSSIMSS